MEGCVRGYPAHLLGVSVVRTSTSSSSFISMNYHSDPETPRTETVVGRDKHELGEGCKEMFKADHLDRCLWSQVMVKQTRKSSRVVSNADRYVACSSLEDDLEPLYPTQPVCMYIVLVNENKMVASTRTPPFAQVRHSPEYGLDTAGARLVVSRLQFRYAPPFTVVRFSIPDSGTFQ